MESGFQSCRFAKSMGVSRIPLREAYQILASEGLIVSSANRGARVRILVPRNIDQILHRMVHWLL
jgi:DNA-binding GntR family transcriptional regulator